jgi:hypothetical protein
MNTVSQQPFEFAHYMNGKMYESRNGRIVFDDSLHKRIMVCRDITYKKYDIKLDFVYSNKLHKTHGHVGLFVTSYKVNCTYSHTKYNDLEVRDIVIDMFKYCGISYEHDINDSTAMTASTVNMLFNRRESGGHYKFRSITIYETMYSEAHLTFGPEMFFA